MKKKEKKITEERQKEWFNAVVQNNIETIQRMISEGFDIETRQNDAPNGWTALHEACYRGHIEMAKLLLDNGADVNVVKGKDKTTSLHIASSYGCINIIKLLVDNGESLVLKHKDGDPPLGDLKRHHPQKYNELTEWLMENYPDKMLELMAHEKTQSKGIGL